MRTESQSYHAQFRGINIATLERTRLACRFDSAHEVGRGLHARRVRSKSKIETEKGSRHGSPKVNLQGTKLENDLGSDLDIATSKEIGRHKSTTKEITIGVRGCSRLDLSLTTRN